MFISFPVRKKAWHLLAFLSGFQAFVAERISLKEGPSLRKWGNWSPWSTCNGRWKDRERYVSAVHTVSPTHQEIQHQARKCDRQMSHRHREFIVPIHNTGQRLKVNGPVHKDQPEKHGSRSRVRHGTTHSPVSPGRGKGGNRIMAGINCPDGYSDGFPSGQIFENGTTSPSCYKVNKNLMSWVLAIADCTISGGHLVSIESWEEQMHIQQFMKEYRGSQSYFTSGTDMAKEEHWIWAATEREVGFSFWLDGEPNNGYDKFPGESYLTLTSRQSRRWNDVPSTAEHYYICEAFAI